MDFLKFSRGHFFGVIIPGIFLLFNIVFLGSEFIGDFISKDIKGVFNNDTPYFITVFLILSYVLGIIIRLFRPSKLEKLAFLIRWVVHILKLGTKKLNILIRKVFKTKDNGISKEDIKSLADIQFYKQEFPYLAWFFDSYLKKVGLNYRKFYRENILLHEFDTNIEAIKAKNFFNQCKMYIYTKSESVTEELLYNEGLSRFISGLIYSFIISIFMIVPQFSKFAPLFYLYLVLLIFSLLQLRSIRIKEVLAVFDAYMIIKSEEIQKQNMNN